MKGPGKSIRWVILITATFWAVQEARAQPYSPAQSASPASGGLVRASSEKAGTVQLPWKEIPARVREQVRKVVEQPRVSAQGTPEDFYGRPALYHWMLDHPDRAAVAWRRLGATCVDITDLGNDRFGVNDGQGTEVTWETIYRGPAMRIWYAEATSKPRPLLRAVPVQAVVLLHYSELKDAAGRTIIHHQADLYLHTDSKSAILMTKLLGNTAPKMAEQCANQLETFFSGLMGYVERYPQLEKEMREPFSHAAPTDQTRQAPAMAIVPAKDTGGVPRATSPVGGQR